MGGWSNLYAVGERTGEQTFGSTVKDLKKTLRTSSNASL